MLARIIYGLATLSIATLGVSADKNMAWLYSGDLDTCNREKWDDTKEDSPQGRDMDGMSCIADQPVGGDRRRNVWFPDLIKKEMYGFFYEERLYCLVMKKANDCKGSGEPGDLCMEYDDTLDITLNATSENCLPLPGTGDDNGAISYQAFQFQPDVNCAQWKKNCEKYKK